MPIDQASVDAAPDPSTLSLSLLLPALAGIYITQVLITTIAMKSLPVLLRQAGASLEQAGLSALFMLPWALRFLWAPVVERWRLPVGSMVRRSRFIILCGQWLLAAGMIAVAGAGIVGWLSLSEDGSLLLGLFFLAALLSATIDVACGGLAVDQLTQERRGLGNTVKVGASYLGTLLGGSAFLLLTGYHGWPWALGATGIAIILLGLPLLRTREPARSQVSQAQERPSLRHAWRRPRMRQGLLLAFTLGAGVRIAFGMTGTLLHDKGASLVELAWLFGAFSIIAGLVGTALGGLLTRWAGGWQAVWLAVALQAMALAALAWGVAIGVRLHGLTILVGLLFALMACGFVAIYSALMGLTSPSQPGVDFALFQCADAFSAMAGGVAGGWLAQHYGYDTCFALAASLAAGAAVFAAYTGRTLDKPRHTCTCANP